MTFKRAARPRREREDTFAGFTPKARPTAVASVVREPMQAIQKDQPLRSQAYRRWVASLPCIACGIVGYSQCAHANGGGMGTKDSDLRTFALCCTRPGHMGCHMQFDLCIDMTQAQRRELTEDYVSRTQAMALQAKRPELTEAT
jgi:hypothetical protein